MTHTSHSSCPLPRGLLAMLLSATVALAACGDKSAPSAASSGASAAAATQSSDNVLRYAMSFKEKGSMAIESDAALRLKTAGANETLVNVTADGQVLPSLATEWKRTGATTWEFTLRPDVKFHDGSTLDAEAVVTSLGYIMGTATPPRALKGTGLTAKAIDAHTVQISTEQPDPVLPLRLGSPSSAILAKGAYASNPMTSIGFGSGPFKITKDEPGVSLTLVRFDEYWGGKAALNGVEVLTIMDHTARYNALKAGEVRIADSVLPGKILEFKKDSAYKVEGIALPRSTTLYTNFSKPVLANLKIRQAIDMLIDRQAIVATVLEGTGTPAAGYFGDAVPWAPKAAERPADYLEQAKKLIADSGIKPEGLKLNLMTYTGRPELAEAANVIKANLEQAGFTITLDVVEYTTVLEPKALAKEHDLILMSRSYYFDMPDAAGYLQSDFGCKGSNNFNVFCDKAFDALLQGTATAEKPQERTAIFAKAAQYLIDNKVGLPIYHDASRRVLSSRVQNTMLDPLDQTLLTNKTTLGK